MNKANNPRREKYVLTDFNAVYGLYETKERAETSIEKRGLKRWTPSVVQVFFMFSEAFEKWYNEKMMGLGEDIYCTDGDCLLAGIYEEGEDGKCKQGVEVGVEYLLSNIDWCIECDESNMGYVKREYGLSDPQYKNEYDCYRKHRNAMKKFRKEIENWAE